MTQVMGGTKANTGVLRYALRASLRMTGTKSRGDALDDGKNKGRSRFLGSVSLRDTTLEMTQILGGSKTEADARAGGHGKRPQTL